jgi:hypothetical protein
MESGRPIRLVGAVQRAFAKSAIDAAPDGWIVIVKEENRRDAQNRLFWEVMGDLAKCEPDGRRWTKETWRDAIMHALGHQVQFAESLDGSGPFPIGFRSSKLSVPQMTMVLDYAFSYGAQRGVIFTIDRRRAAETFRGMAA